MKYFTIVRMNVKKDCKLEEYINKPIRSNGNLIGYIVEAEEEDDHYVLRGQILIDELIQK